MNKNSIKISVYSKANEVKNYFDQKFELYRVLLEFYEKIQLSLYI